MTRKAFVLLSGGLDSTTCLYKAIHDYFPEDPQQLIKDASKYKRQYPDDKRSDEDKKKKQQQGQG